jgi:N4-gp56 family major capsid protein
MAYDLIGTAGLTEGLKQFYSRKLLERALPNFVHLQWADTNGIPRNNGKSIEWRRYERPTATTTALTEGTPGSQTNVTISIVTATISQYGQYDVITDVVDMQNYDPIIGQLTEVFGETMADSLDQVARNVITAGSTVQYASVATTRGGASGVGSGMLLNFAEVREAVATLENNDASKYDGGKFAAIIHPHTKYDLFADSDVIQSFQQAGERGMGNQMMTGELGTFYGVDWVVTSNARVQSSLGLSNVDVYQTLIMGRGFYGSVSYDAMGNEIIVKPVGSAGTSDPLNQIGSVGWKANLAVAILNENFGVRIEHAASLGQALK